MYCAHLIKAHISIGMNRTGDVLLLGFIIYDFSLPLPQENASVYEPYTNCTHHTHLQPVPAFSSTANAELTKYKYTTEACLNSCFQVDDTIDTCFNFMSGMPQRSICVLISK